MKDITLKPELSIRKFNRSSKGMLVIINLTTLIEFNNKRKQIFPVR